MGGINPVLHLNQHWYISILLGLILEVFIYLLMTILSLKWTNIIITRFLFVIIIRLFDKSDFIMVEWCTFINRIFNSINHGFLFFSGGYFDPNLAGKIQTPKKCTNPLRSDLVLQIYICVHNRNSSIFAFKVAMIHWYIIGKDFRRIQLLVDNNYMPQKKYRYFLLWQLLQNFV